MDVRTGSKSWGYSKRPRNWKKIMYKEIDEIPEVEEIPEIDEKPEVEEIPEIDKIIHTPEVEEKPKIGQGLESEASIDEKPQIGQGLESEASIEKPKITARLSNPDSSFSYMYEKLESGFTCM